jgi:hypothetical protein
MHLFVSFIWVDRWELIAFVNIDSLPEGSMSNLVDWLASVFLQVLVHFASFVTCRMISFVQCTFWPVYLMVLYSMLLYVRNIDILCIERCVFFCLGASTVIFMLHKNSIS